MAVGDDYVRKIVEATLAAERENQTKLITEAIERTLMSFGIEASDHAELKADFRHLRTWRKSVDQAQSYTVKAVITVLVSGVVGAMWLGIKTLIAWKM